MSDIRKYVIVAPDNTEDDNEYDNYNACQEAANKRNSAVIARIYEYSDSELIWTPDGSDTWPPEMVDKLDAIEHQETS